MADLRTEKQRDETLREILSLEDRAGRVPPNVAVELLSKAAELRLQLDDHSNALSLLRRALQLKDDYKPALNRYTKLCASLERWSELAEALDLAARAARNDAERARVLAHRGDVLGKRLGRLAEARSTYREVARIADPDLRRAALEAVDRLDKLISQQPANAPAKRPVRERTFVGRRPSEAPIEGARQRRATITDRAKELFDKAQQMMRAARYPDARALIEQGLAMDRWHEEGLRLRRELLRSEGRLQDLLRLLVVESEEAPAPQLAQEALREAARVVAGQGDLDGALLMYRRSLMLGNDEQTITEAIGMAVKSHRLDVGKRLLPDVSAVIRAQKFEQLAAAAAAVGDHRTALEYRAVAFDDRPDDVGFFQARIQLQSVLGDHAGVEATLRRRLAVVVDPDERQATLWELAARCEADGRWRDAASPLIDSIASAAGVSDVTEALKAVDRLAKLAQDPTLLARAYEAAVFRRADREGDHADWLVTLARLRRDELCDLEGAEAAFRAAIAAGADVGAELHQLEAKLGETATQLGAMQVVENLARMDSDSMSAPLVVGVADEQLSESDTGDLPAVVPGEFGVFDAVDTKTDESALLAVEEPTDAGEIEMVAKSDPETVRLYDHETPPAMVARDPSEAPPPLEKPLETPIEVPRPETPTTQIDAQVDVPQLALVGVPREAVLDQVLDKVSAEIVEPATPPIEGAARIESGIASENVTEVAAPELPAEQKVVSVTLEAEVIDERPSSSVVTPPPAETKESTAPSFTPEILGPLHRGALEESFAAVPLAIAAQEIDAASWIALGRAAIDAGREEDAKICFDRGIDLARVEGVEACAAALIAEALDCAGDVEAAARAKVVWTAEGEPRLRAARAERLAEEWAAEGDPWLEELWLEAALALDCGLMSVAEILAERYVKRGAPNEAQQLITHVVPDVDRAATARWLVRVAAVEADRGDLVRAASALERAIDLAPLDPEPARALAELGVRAMEPPWLAASLAVLRDRCLWSGAISGAAIASFLRLAFDMADPRDRFLTRVLGKAVLGESPGDLDPSTEAGRAAVLALLSADVLRFKR